MLHHDTDRELGPDKRTVDDTEIERLLTVLLRSVASSDHGGHMKAYTTLLDHGTLILRQLVPKILEADWASVEHPIKLKMFRAMFMLLHNVDEAEANRVAKTLSARRCDPLVSAHIRGVLSHSEAEFRRYDRLGISVYQSGRLRHGDFVRRLFSRWLSELPEAHLEGIKRIYVMPFGEFDEDAYGTYDKGLGQIHVSWDDSFHPFNPLGRLWLWASAKRTLYHEIGHHVLGHTGGPRDDSKERAADWYAGRLLFRCSYFLIAIRKTIQFLAYVLPGLVLRRREWLTMLTQQWENDGVSLKEAASAEAVEKFERHAQIKLPKHVRSLVENSNGMAEDTFCGNGFRFRSLREFEVVERENFRESNLIAQKFLVFSEHLPNGVQYLIEVSSDRRHKNRVFRGGCRTRSGLLDVAPSFPSFVRMYLRNHPILFA